MVFLIFLEPPKHLVSFLGMLMCSTVVACCHHQANEMPLLSNFIARPECLIHYQHRLLQDEKDLSNSVVEASSQMFLSAELTNKIGEQVKCYVMATIWEEVTSRDLLNGKSSIFGGKNDLTFSSQFTINYTRSIFFSESILVFFKKNHADTKNGFYRP